MRKKSYQLFLFFAFCLLPFALSSCGYASRTIYRGPYKTVFIEPFTNKVDVLSEDATSLSQRFRTYHPLMENDIRSAVINRFMYDGGFRVAKKDEADIVLKGELIDYKRDALRYENNQEDVSEYRISLVMRLTLYKRGMISLSGMSRISLATALILSAEPRPRAKRPPWIAPSLTWPGGCWSGWLKTGNDLSFLPEKTSSPNRKEFLLLRKSFFPLIPRVSITIPFMPKN